MSESISKALFPSILLYPSMLTLNTRKGFSHRKYKIFIWVPNTKLFQIFSRLKLADIFYEKGICPIRKCKTSKLENQIYI